MNVEYDYLIVGSGLFGAIFAYEAKKNGKKCLVIEKRNHLGGNVFCKKIEDINVHAYGAHIFHTNDKKIWNYINQFAEFNGYINSPLANYNGELFNLPFNMNTFYQFWKTTTPQEAQDKIASQVMGLNIGEPQNLEEQALALVGPDIYKKLIKHYTEKQWGRKATSLPAFLIRRLPLRFTFNNNYFNDRYQGIPVGGYNKIINGLLEGIETRINIDYIADRDELQSIAKKIVYTGKIDEFFNYQFGELEYRSLRFDEEVLKIKNFQGNAVVNYCDPFTPFTRIIEHKHFEFGNQPTTVISREYPMAYKKGSEAFYPINDLANNTKLEKYNQLKLNFPNFIFGGRLAEYRYYDMHQIVGAALQLVKRELI
ncbi:MAG: UDP-galactopyranose mutase [Mucilaginibacter sp.]|nr:UDP-galactopyranose mutase [Mucilaginibacter sp.]